MPLPPKTADSPQMGDSCPPICSPSSMEEATSLAREAFEEWMQNPSGNSATANLRNKLCVVIGEREDLKAQIVSMLQTSGESVKRWKAEYDELDRERIAYRAALKQIVHNPGWQDPEVGFMSGHIAAGVLNQFPENARAMPPAKD